MRFEAISEVMRSRDDGYDYSLNAKTGELELRLFEDESLEAGTKLRFEGVIAYRVFAERFSSLPLGARSNTLGMIVESEWLLEVLPDPKSVHDKYRPRKHFYIYMADVGTFEVLAAEVTAAPS